MECLNRKPSRIKMKLSRKDIWSFLVDLVMTFEVILESQHNFGDIPGKTLICRFFRMYTIIVDIQNCRHFFVDILSSDNIFVDIIDATSSL